MPATNPQKMDLMSGREGEAVGLLISQFSGQVASASPNILGTKGLAVPASLNGQKRLPSIINHYSFYRRLTPPNQSMKPTAPLRCKFSLFATTPCRGLLQRAKEYEAERDLLSKKEKRIELVIALVARNRGNG